MDTSEVDNDRCAATELLNEGNYLQSLEEFSNTLINHPNDPEAVEGRLFACLELKLFHRCLEDIERLVQIKPSDTKVHNLAGQIYEQIGLYDKSICAYLKAYLYGETENRCERVKKISQLCGTLLHEADRDVVPGKRIDCFESLVILSQKLAEQEKFQAALEMVVTVIKAHCLDEPALKTFENELDLVQEIELPTFINEVQEDSKKMEISFEKFTCCANATRATKSETDLTTSSLNVEYNVESLPDKPAINLTGNAENNPVSSCPISSSGTKIAGNSKTPGAKDELNENSSVTGLYSPMKSSNGLSLESTRDEPDMLLKQPAEAGTDAQTVNKMLLQASECCYRLGKLGTSIWFAKKLLQNSQNVEDIISILKAHSQLGFLYIKCGDNECGLLWYIKLRLKCREFLETKNTLEKEIEISVIERKTTLKLCLLCKDLELYNETEAYLQELFSKFEVIEQDSLVTAYGILGSTELSQGLYDEAIRSFKTQLALCLKYNDQKGLVLAYGNLGNACKTSGDGAKAMEWFQRCLRTASIVNNSFCLATAYSKIGEGLLSENSPQKALTYFEKQLNLCTVIDERTLRVQALFSLGKTYQNLKLLQHAEFFLKRALLEDKYLKMHLNEEISEHLAQVLLTLGKHKEGLKLLYEMLDRLQSKFHKLCEYKIVTLHPLLDKLNTCTDQILVLLAEEGRTEEGLLLAERSNSIVYNRMLAYKAYVQGMETISTHPCATPAELYKLVNNTNKVVLYYRIVRNGFMVWVIGPSKGMVYFHWHKAPIGSSFKETVEDLFNNLLQAGDPSANYRSDHRKLPNDLQMSPESHNSGTSRSTYTPQRSKLTFKCTPSLITRSRQTSVGLNSRSTSSPQSTYTSTNTTGITSKFKNTSQDDTSKDFFRELSKLFIAPIEEVLTNTLELKSHDLVIVSSSFLNVIPFADLRISSGNSLEGLVNSLQLVPCISSLKILEATAERSSKRISIIGNPEIKFPKILAGFQGQLKPDFMEKELNHVSILLGSIPDIGMRATKERFLSRFNSSTLMHLATYGSHRQGTITLAPIADINPRVITDSDARESWEITLEDIVASCSGPEVVVLTSAYGCRNQFHTLAGFNAYIPLACMLAGVKTVVMATWSVPQDALLASLRHFYKNISNGLTVGYALSKAKNHLRRIQKFHEPLHWASFKVYGRDSWINLETLRRSVAEASFGSAQNMAVERFDFGHCNQESFDGVLCQHLTETVIGLLHRHHLRPQLLPILLQVTQEAITILQNPPSNVNTSALPYREISPLWIAAIRNVENFLRSVGFLIKTMTSRKTILVYPHWNGNNCLQKVESLLQSVRHIVTCSPHLTDALRVVLSQEEKSSLLCVQNVLQARLLSPYAITQTSHNPVVRMFWLKRNTRRLMVQLGFRQVGDVLEFRNDKEDRNAVESCLNIFSLLAEFENITQIEPHPMLSKANFGESWMTFKVNDEEYAARYCIAKSMDSIDAKYKLAMGDLRKWHKGVLLTQAKIAESKTKKAKLDQGEFTSIRNPTETSKLPLICHTSKRQPVDLVELKSETRKVKVKSGAGPSSVRFPVENEQPLPLMQYVMQSHEATRNVRRCLGDMRRKNRDDIRRLLSL